jgi:hypothetical protein
MLSQYAETEFEILTKLLISGLYCKHIMIVNYDSSVVNKFGASLTDNARVVIYDHHMFIVQATGVLKSGNCTCLL